MIDLMEREFLKVSQQKLSEVWVFFDLSGWQKAQAAEMALQGL
jgi:hypothetical protein